MNMKFISAYIAFLIFILSSLSGSISLAWNDNITHVELSRKVFKEYPFLRDYLSDNLKIDFNAATFSLTQCDDGINPGKREYEYERFLNLKTTPLLKFGYYNISDFILAGAEAEDYPNVPKYIKLDWFDASLGKLDIPLLYNDPDIRLYKKLGGSRASHHFHDPFEYAHPGLDNLFSFFMPPTYAFTLAECDLRGISAANRASGTLLFGSEDVSGAKPLNYFDWKHAREYYLKALTSQTAVERSHFFALTFLSLGHIMHLAEDMGVPSHARNDFSNDHVYSRGSRFFKGLGWYNLEDYVKKNKTDFIAKLASSQIPNVDQEDLFRFWDSNGLTPLGLSEYSQPGFLSLGTMFKNYAQPDISKCIFNYQKTEDDYWTAYLLNKSLYDEPIPHLARYSTKAHMLTDLTNMTVDSVKSSLMLDARCYDDYADLLIPKSIAYASGVLKHFFRGKIDAMILQYGRMEIKNLSDEEMSGIFTLYYDYLGDRKPIKGASWNTYIPPGGTDITSSSFSAPEGSSLILVFNGKLGDESGAVVGRVFTPYNRLVAWKIHYYGDDSQYLEEYWNAGLSPKCWPSWTGAHFSFSQTGQRTLYYLLAYQKDPNRIRPFCFPDKQVTAKVTLATSYPRDPFFNNYVHSYTWLDKWSKGFATVENNCGDPTGSLLLDFRKKFISLDHLHYIYGYLGCETDTGIDVAPPYKEYYDAVYLTREEVGNFVSSLHPGLLLPEEMDQPETIYALVTIPVPRSDEFDFSHEYFVNNTGRRLDCSRISMIPGVYLMWDVDNVSLTYDAGRGLNTTSMFTSTIYGPGFSYSREAVRQGERSGKLWTYNPYDPFVPLYSPLN